MQFTNDNNSDLSNNNESFDDFDPTIELYSFNFPYNPPLTIGDTYYIGINCNNSITNNIFYDFCPVIYFGSYQSKLSEHCFETHRPFKKDSNQIYNQPLTLKDYSNIKVEMNFSNLNFSSFIENFYEETVNNLF